MKVVFLGLRGFPGVQGGIETHVEHLAPRLVKLGCDVHVITRAPFQPRTVGPRLQGVQFHNLWCPRTKGLEALIHTFLGVIYAAFLRPDVLHIHAIGPAIMAPLARLLGMRVVVTHHGPDYDRQKWGFFGKTILKTGEALGMRFANTRIVISNVIRQLVLDKYGLDSVLIPNGVEIQEPPTSQTALAAFGLAPRKYILLVSRLVPEKRHLDLIAAFRDAALPGWKLALVGASDHPDAYQQQVIDEAARTPNVVMTGFQTGLALRELYAHAGLFVLPSSHEGLPIALLEALSYGLPVIASDIPANLEVGLPEHCHFPVGNVSSLTKMILDIANKLDRSTAHLSTAHLVREHFDWSRIAVNTVTAYSQLEANAHE